MYGAACAVLMVMQPDTAAAQSPAQMALLQPRIDRFNKEIDDLLAEAEAALNSGDCPGYEAKIAKANWTADQWGQASRAAARHGNPDVPPLPGWAFTDVQDKIAAAAGKPCPPPAAETGTVGSVPGTGTIPQGATLLAGGSGGFLQIWIAGDGQVFCTYGPTIPEPTSAGGGAPGDDPRDGPGKSDGDDPRDGPPKRPDVPDYGRTPEQQAAYSAWYDAVGDYWAGKNEEGADRNGNLPGRPL